MTRDKNRKYASDDSEEIIARADALLARHRKQQDEQAPLQHAPTLDTASNAIDEDDADIPLLTDIAPDPDFLSSDSKPSSTPTTQGAGIIGGEIEVISRVQTQNLEHGEKLRKDLD